jgi:hypothetical protein
MNEARVTWVNEMQFVAETGSGHAIVLESGKEAKAPSPMEMLLVGLAGCTAVDVVHILKRMRQPVTDVQVNVKGVRAGQSLHPDRGRIRGDGARFVGRKSAPGSGDVGDDLLLGIDYTGQNSYHHQ